VILSDLTRVVFRGYRTVLACVVLAVLVALPLILLQSPQYRSTATLYVEVPLPDSADDDQLEDAEFAARQRTITIKELVDSDLVLADVAAALDPPMSAAELATHVTALSALNTTLVDVIVVWPDAEGAASVANAIAQNAIDVASASKGPDSPELVVVQSKEAIAPNGPFSPNVPFILGLAIAAGLLLGIGVVLIRHAFSPRIWTAMDLAAWPDIPVLSTVKSPDVETGYKGALQGLEATRTGAPLVVVDSSRSGVSLKVANALQAASGDSVDVRATDARLDLGEPIQDWVRGADVVVVVERRASRRADVASIVERLRLLGAGRLWWILVLPDRRRAR